jgi:hypothetical protein
MTSQSYSFSIPIFFLSYESKEPGWRGGSMRACCRRITRLFDDHERHTTVNRAPERVGQGGGVLPRQAGCQA